jgi:formyl-CoA transferase/CoA:oxalate CoA-transferase
MLDGLVSWTAARHGTQFFATGKQPEMGGRPSHVYQTKDGKKICVAPAEPWFWERLCRALSLEEYIPYHQQVMSWTPSDKEKRDEITSRMAEVFSTKTRDEWFQILREADTCVSPVYTLEEVFSDPQIIHRQMIVEANDPELGKIKQVGIVPKLSETPGSIRTLPPKHGEHSDELLRNLGYTAEQVEEFRKAGVVK